MDVRRTIPLSIPLDQDLIGLAKEFTRFCSDISSIAFNNGKPLHSVPLHQLVYRQIKTSLLSQMKCSAIRKVAGAYGSAKSNKHKVTKPFVFKKNVATLLFGREFSFKKDGTISISTLSGRKRFAFSVPNYAINDFKNAKSYDSLTVLGNGKVSLCITLSVPDPVGLIPTGIDLGMKNALVASTITDTLFISGSKLQIKNRRKRQLRSRLQKKLALHKANNHSTRSVRRLLKRLGRSHRNRNVTFCKESAAKLCAWVPKDSVLVFEDLNFKQQSKKNYKQRKGTRRKLSQFFYNAMMNACKNRAERDGFAIALVNPAYTSQKCRMCGSIGTRFGSKFSCLCGHAEHADINASHNIRSIYAALRDSGAKSTAPCSGNGTIEAQAKPVRKYKLRTV